MFTPLTPPFPVRGAGRRSSWRAVTPALLLVGTLACNDLSGLAGTQALPSGTPDPSVYHTAAGALALFQETLVAFQSQTNSSNLEQGGGSGAFTDYMLASGLLSDELQAGDLGCQGSSAGVCTASSTDNADARQLPDETSSPTADTYFDNVYNELQGIRGGAFEGIGALTAYDASAPLALRGQLYALQGYAEILLGDLFCSGVPLSTFDFNGDYTYHAGSTTTQIYQDAVARFDTALSLSGDSTRIMNLARVGKGRAFLDLGQFDSAAATVAAVPTGFSYQFDVEWANSSVGDNSVFTAYNSYGVTVSDSEGTNGLPFRSNGDPRDSVQQAGVNSYGQPTYLPLKYGGATPTTLPITVADWIEARLITAEAAWHNPGEWGSWLDQLNSLRATAITPALPSLSDPGSPAAQVDLLFQERAYWLFLTGHRQGDLRRLIREYGSLGFTQATVYPTGAYPFGAPATYGTDVTAPIPSAESVNPLFTGCLSRGA